MSERTLLAVDPGTSKCGLALVRRSAEGGIELLWRRIAQRAELVEAIQEAGGVHAFSLLVVGAGTSSRDVVQQIHEAMPGLDLLKVDERDTTLQARERYWEHVPRTGWRRLLPATLQLPPEPIDDFAALVLAERVLLA